MSNLSREEVQQIVEATVKATLFDLGLRTTDENAIEEVRKDLAHLRKWRNSVEQVQSTTFMVAFGIVVTGLVGMLWLGLKASLFGQ